MNLILCGISAASVEKDKEKNSAFFVLHCEMILKNHLFNLKQFYYYLWEGGKGQKGRHKYVFVWFGELSRIKNLPTKCKSTFCPNVDLFIPIDIYFDPFVKLSIFDLLSRGTWKQRLSLIPPLSFLQTYFTSLQTLSSALHQMNIKGKLPHPLYAWVFNITLSF